LCASVLIALVLCPFTAPYASYNPNAIPIGVEDGAPLDTSHVKDVTVAAGPIAMADFIALAPVDAILNVAPPLDISSINVVVLRV
jgi:hypothetical protein